MNRSLANSRARPGIPVASPADSRLFFKAFLLVISSLGLFSDEQPGRIHIPIEDLSAVRAKYPKAVLLDAMEYKNLRTLVKARENQSQKPRVAAIRKASYSTIMEDGYLRLSGDLEFVSLANEAIDLVLPFEQIGFDRIQLSENAAPLWLGDKGKLNIRLPGNGTHHISLKGFIPLQETPGGGTRFNVRIPGAVSGTFTLMVSGDQEIHTNVPVLREDYDSVAGKTTIELAIGGHENIQGVLIGNGHRDDQRAILIGNSATTITLDPAGQVLDSLQTLQVLRKGIREFTFRMDPGWTVTEISSPDLVRWSVKDDKDGTQLLRVDLRNSTTGTKTIQFRAHAPPAGFEWPGPRLVLQDADFQRGHLLVDPGTSRTFRAETKKNSLRQDLSTASRVNGLTSSNGRLFFHWGDEWGLNLLFAPVDLERHSDERQLLVAAPSGLSLESQFEVTAVGHEMTHLVFNLPSKELDWELASVKLDGKSEGFDYRIQDIPEGQELRINLAKSIPPEGLASIGLVLRRIPPEWSSFLSGNSNVDSIMQDYPIIDLEAAKTKGLVAFVARGHLEVEPGNLPEDWSQINVGKLGALGLINEVRSAARYVETNNNSISLTVNRAAPRMKATSAGLYTIQTGSLRGAFRIKVEVSRAPVRRIFVLAEKSLGQELNLSVQGHRLSSRRIVEPGGKTLILSESQIARYNLWQLDLDKQVEGTLQINVQFHLAQDGPNLDLPLVRLAGADQLTEFAAIEAGEEFEIEVSSEGTREVDPIDLPELPVQARRILSAHRFLPETTSGAGVKFKLSSGTLENYAIPSILAVEASLKTQVGIRGSQQTEARWQVANVSRQFLEVRLPEDSELWSAQVAGEPVKPKSGKEGILLPLPLTREPVEISVVFFKHGDASDLSDLKLMAPELPGVPLNETRWEVIPPVGYRLSDHDSNLTTDPGKFKLKEPTLFTIFRNRNSWKDGANVDDAMAPKQMMDAIEDGKTEMENIGIISFNQIQMEMPAEEQKAGEKLNKKVPTKQGSPPPPVANKSPTRPVKKEMSNKDVAGKDYDLAGTLTGKTGQTRMRGRFTLPVNLVVSGSGTHFHGLGNPELIVKFAHKGRHNDHAGIGTVLALIIGFLLWLKLTFRQKSIYLLLALLVSTLTTLWIPGMGEFANGFFIGTFIWSILWPSWALGWRLLCWLWKLFAKTPACHFLRRQLFRIAWGGLAMGLFHVDGYMAEDPAILVPYGKEGPNVRGQEERVLLPYENFVRLWNQAHPNEPLDLHKKPARVFLREPVFEGRLVNDDTFEIKLRVSVEVDAPGVVDLPLPFENVALQELLLDGAAAPVAARREGGIILHMKNEGKGILEVRGVTKPEIRGRAGSVNLKIPALPAAILNVNLLDPELELEATGTIFQPTRKDSEWQLPVGNLQNLNLRWRPKVGSGSEDRTLTAATSHQVHVFHWGMIGVSTVNYSFSGGERDQFHVLLPFGVRLSELQSANLRDHRPSNKVQVDGNLFQAVDVRLHRAVKKQHELQLRWIAPFPMENVESRIWLPRAGDVGRESGRVELHTSMGVGMKVHSVEGGRRINRASARQTLNVSADTSRFEGSYEWPYRPFALKWEVERKSGRAKTELKQLIRISPEEVQLLGNVTAEAEDGLIFGSSFLLPQGYDVLNVVGPDIERWHIQEEGMGNLLHVDYRVARLKTSLAIVLLNEDPKLQAFNAPLIRATTPEGQLMEDQKGQVAVQVAPALEARTLESHSLRPRPRSSVSGWLDARQVNMVQFAYDSDGMDASLKLGISQRPSKVGLEMLAGVLVEETVAYYTYRLRYNVEGSPLDRLRFTLPETVAKDVALVSPALRGIQHKPIGDGLHQWEVSLVNEVTGLVDIGVNFSRQIGPDTSTLDIPELKTNADAGYRAILAVQNFSRHQLELMGSPGIRAATLEEQQDVLDEPIRRSLQFVHQSFQPGWDARLALTYAQETKRLEAVIDLLSMRTFISKSGRCVYEVTLSLQNRAEQFIELMVPEPLRLWSAEVDGQPVKPVYPKGAGLGRVAIPLVKTTVAGLPFEAKLFFAGNLGMKLKSGEKVKPPAIQVTNIPVKRTNWSLQLPEDFEYHDPKGNMDPVAGTTELLALGVEAKLDQLKRISSSSSRKMRYGKKGYYLKKSLSKELAVLEKQIDFNKKGLERNSRDFNDEERGRLDRQISQQKVILKNLNEQLQQKDGEVGNIAILNGFLNDSLVNPGISEWDRNGVLNRLPEFVSSAQAGQVANLNVDFSSNSELLNTTTVQNAPNQSRTNAPAPIPQAQQQISQAAAVQQRQQLHAEGQSAQGLLSIATRQPIEQHFQFHSNESAELAEENQQELTLSGGTIMDLSGRAQQITKRQEFLSQQLGNLADNRLNRYYQGKGKNIANARNQSGQLLDSPNGISENIDGLKGFKSDNLFSRNPVNANINGTYKSEIHSLDKDPFGGVGGGGAGIPFAYGGINTPVKTSAYSLSIQLPEGGRQLDFSYPGNNPVISLRVRDTQVRYRNYATLGLLGIFATVFSIAKWWQRKRTNR